MPQAPLSLSGWFVISLRPVGQQGAVRRAIRGVGAIPLSVPGLRLRMRDDVDTRDALAAALACKRVIFTSPVAVRSAAQLQTLAAVRKPLVMAIGRGTQAALRREAIGTVVCPPIETSEGLLALPELHDVAGVSIGLVTAPGGRGLLASTLTARGAELRIAQVYSREPARLTRRHFEALLDAKGSGALLLSSAEAFTNVLAALPEVARSRLRDCLVVASSARLAEIARAAAFMRIVSAAGANPREMLAALVAHAKSERFA